MRLWRIAACVFCFVLTIPWTYSQLLLPSSINCDFGKDQLCGWEVINTTSTYKWKLSENFLRLNFCSEDGSTTSRASITSGILRGQPGLQVCLTFDWLTVSYDKTEPDQLVTSMRHQSRLHSRKHDRQGNKSREEEVLKDSSWINGLTIWRSNILGNKTTWQTARIQLRIPEVKSQLMFSGLSFNCDASGYMGLRNLRMDYGLCSGTPESKEVVFDSSHRPTQYNQSPSSSSNFDCNFESGMCGWGSDNSREIDWDVVKGTSDQREYRPKFDHTTETVDGQYLLLDQSKRNSIGRVISPAVTLDTAGRCVQFWFYLVGSNAGSIEVFVRPKARANINRKGELFWSRRGQQENQWLYGQFFVRKDQIEGDEIEIIFQGETGSIQSAATALDDITSTVGQCPHYRMCDFESVDMCGYSNEATNTMNWTRTTASQLPPNGLAPSKDHTYQSPEGYFMLASQPADSSLIGQYVEGQLMTSRKPYQSTTSRCLTFWYHISDARNASLGVLYKGGNGAHQKVTTLWRRTEDRSSRWRKAMATIVSAVEYQIYFQASYGFNSTGFMAIDDINFEDGSCPPTAGCTFEEDFCSFFNEEDLDDFDWVRQNGITDTKNTGPSTDHTTGTVYGYYVYIESSYPRKSGNRAWMVSEIIPPGLFCLNFWYHMKGRSVGQLNVYTNDTTANGSPVALVWSREGEQSNQWMLATVNISSVDEFEVVFEGVIGKGYNGDIALDDISAHTGSCPKVETPPDSFKCNSGGQSISWNKLCDFVKDCLDGSDEANCGTCDFNDGLCGYKDFSNGHFQWTRSKSGTDILNTGPVIDSKNSSNGYFMFVEALNTSNYGMAQMQTGVMQRPNSNCTLEFYVHMTSLSAYESLTVNFVLDDENIIPILKLFHKNYTNWQQIKVNLGRLDVPFVLQFVGERSLSNSGDVAIDDVKMTDCALPDNSKSTCLEYQCKRGGCVPESRTCDFTDDCGDESDESSIYCSHRPLMCTFEASLCGWTQDDNNGWPWIRMHTHDTGNYVHSPLRDHTTGSNFGTYLGIKQPGTPFKSYIYSPAIFGDRSEPCSLRFYYHTGGSSIGHLNVLVQSYADRSGILLWNSTSIENENIFGWRRVELFSPVKDLFQFVFEAVNSEAIKLNSTEGTYFSNIAIDDLSLTPSCSLSSDPLPTAIPTMPPCTHDEFTCKNGQCISISKKCDFTLDCSDGSDEIGCGPCDFETGLCGWKDKSLATYNWTRHQGVTPSYPYTGPTYDHTTRSYTGWYLYAEGGRGNYINPALFVSPPLPEASRLCHVKFWYHMKGQQVGTLRLNLFPDPDSKSSKRLWSLSGNQGIFWNSARVKLGSLNSGFVLSFEADVDRQYSATQAYDIAIDDVSFEECNPKDIPPDLTCTFDSSLCQWKNDTDAKLVTWQKKQGGDGFGPKDDHASGNGTYLFLNYTNGHYDDIASISSPSQHVTPFKGHCFTFWYYMFGPQVSILRLRLYAGNKKENLWERSGSQGNYWHQARASYSSEVKYQLAIEAGVGYQHGGDIAIDDVYMLDGPCPPLPGCDFEEGFCTWTNREDADFDWDRGTPSIFKYYMSGPRVDHTTGTENGHIAYIDSYFNNKNEMAILDSKVYNSDIDRCFQFWYHMWGSGIGSLEIYQRIPGPINTVLIWKKSGNQDNVWRRGQVTVPKPGRFKNYTLSIVASVGGRNGDIAIDDLIMRDGACPKNNLCDFETDLCGWANQYSSGSFQWIRNNGATPTEFTGPTVDHTTETSAGYYVYIESKVSHRPGAKAWLVSETFNSNFGCLDFWYHMYGSGIGNLTVYLQEGNLKPITHLNTISGNHGNVWLNKKINIVAPRDHFNVIIEGTYGANSSGDIALDDITFFQKPCPLNPSTSTPLPPTLPPIYPHTINDCDFEQDICNWTKDLTSDIKWTRHKGSTSSMGTGPHVDHTTGTADGYYIYIEDRLVEKANSSARIFSKEVTSINTDGFCVKFWYHMQGLSINRLSLWIENQKTKQKTLMWTKSGSQCHEWLPGNVGIAKTGIFIIIFDALSSVEDEGDIALDDISINVGSCPQSSLCDFEKDWCLSYQDTSANFKWSRSTGEATFQISSSAPRIDHTYSTNFGHFVYLETINRNQGDIAITNTQLMHPTIGMCLQFWYNMHNYGVGKLTILRTIENSLRRELWSLSSNHYSDEWNKAQITLNSANWFTVAFVGQVGISRNGVLAVDDVFIAPYPCQGKLSCNFEDKLCAWRNELVNSASNWEVGSGVILRSPETDNTLKNKYGKFLYSDMTYPRPVKDKCRYLSETIKNSTRGCLRFYYFIQIGESGVLSFHQTELDNSIISSWLTTPPYTSQWKFGQFFVNNYKSDYRIIAETVVRPEGRGKIAIDDISFLDGVRECPPPPVPDEPCVFKCTSDNRCLPRSKVCNFFPDCKDGEDEQNCGHNCTFESGECGWKDTTDGTFQWKRYRGATQDSNTGPSTDHTTKTANGWYVYVDASHGNSFDLANYASPEQYDSSGTCTLQFYYHMFGRDIGNLAVRFRINSISTLIFFQAGDKGDVWNLASIQIGRISGPFRIIIQGERTFEELGDIAIDDILFKNCDLPQPSPGNCAIDKFQCSNHVCIDRNRVCDYEDDCGDRSDESNSTCSGYPGPCDFEDYGMCHWRQDSTSNIKWLRASKSSPIVTTGPTRDHTTNSAIGHYIYINSMNSKKGSKARIISHAWGQTDADGTKCRLRFFYHMYGKDIGRLTVYLKYMMLGAPLQQVWQHDGQLGNFWERAEIGLISFVPFEVIFEGTVANGKEGDIALDDITFSSGCQVDDTPLPTGLPTYPPQPPTPEPACGKGMWACSSGQCIPIYQRCDWVSQCKDKSDEMMCGQCTFESGLCGWKDNSFGIFKWDRSMARISKGPAVDHTTNSSYGHYVYIDDKNFGSTDTQATLVSPVFGMSGVDCTMSLWFSQECKNGMTGIAIKLNQTFKIRLATIYSAKYPGWNNITIGIGRRYPGFQIVIDSYHNVGNACHVALDDIEFNNCAISTNSTCLPYEFKCANSHCVNKNYVCDFQNDCYDNSDETYCDIYKYRCNFEGSLCNWKIDSSSSTWNWIMTSGMIRDEYNFGPSIDHTCGNATCQFLFFDSTKAGRIGQLVTKDLFVPPPEGQTCSIRFFMHINDETGGSLTGYVNYPNKINSTDIPLFKVNYLRDDSWRRLVFPIPTSNREPFKVIITAESGTTSKHPQHISLDDISFTPEYIAFGGSTIHPQLTTLPPPNFNCSISERSCRDGTCIPAEYFCNFRTDCADLSDEEDCPSVCNFEKGTLCGWHNSYTLRPVVQSKQLGAWGWAIGSGSHHSFTGPKVDHTTNTPNGKYVYIDSQPDWPSRMIIETANFTSPQFSMTGSGCRFSFWYHMFGPQMGHLKATLHQIRNGLIEERKMWEIAGNNGDIWNQGDLLIPPCSQNVSITFTGSILKNRIVDMALDDIRFDNCAYPKGVSGDCGANQLQCPGGVCIEISRKCDLQIDCCGYGMLKGGFDESSFFCKHYVQCTFENGSTCDWFNDNNGDFIWSHGQGSEDSLLNKGPKMDHTFGNNTGQYIFLKYSYYRRWGDRAMQLYSLGPTRYGCKIRFWYYLYGTDNCQLKVGIRTFSDPNTQYKWSTTGGTRDEWQRAEVSLISSVSYLVVLEGIYGRIVPRSLAIDDISFTPECFASKDQPVPTAFPSLLKDCNFEEDSCDYREETSDDFYWTRGSGDSTENNRDQAPGVDAGKGTPTGHYMYIISKSEHSDGKKASLVSPLYSPVYADCHLSFSYLLSGTSTGILSLEMSLSTGNSTRQAVLWNDHGDSGQDWKTMTVGISQRTESFRLTFKNSPFYWYSGKVAIDELNFFDCAVPPRAFKCDVNDGKYFWCRNTQACIPFDRVCDLTDNCGDDSDERNSFCQQYSQEDFEYGLGIFRQGINGTEDDVDWERRQGGSLDYATGPIADHSRGDQQGHYMFMNSDKIPYGRTAWLVTKPINISTISSSNKCQLRFYYNMNGRHVKSLSVHTRIYQNGPPTKTYWTIVGDKGSVWLRKVITLQEFGLFQIIFDGVMGDRYSSDLALDDITLTSECIVHSWDTNMPIAPTAPPTFSAAPSTPHPCEKDEYSCKNTGICIPKSMVCNFIDNCGDNSDEKNCASTDCNFNDGFCNWIPEKSGNFDFSWERIRGKDVPKNNKEYMPSTNANGKADGFFVYADSSLGNFKAQANLTSPYIGQTGPQCKLLFAYYSFGQQLTSLQVVIQGREELSVTPLWYRSGSISPSWNRGAVFLGSRSNFQIQFQARRGFEFIGDLALDQPSFEDCTPPQPSPLPCRPGMFTCSNKVCAPVEFVCDFGNDCGDNSDEMTTQCRVYPGRCDFEHGICTDSWHHDTTGDFDWSYTLAGTPSVGSRPAVDHTTQSMKGHYIFASNSISRSPGEKTRLRSFVIKGSSKDCELRYWFHMIGSQKSSLNIYTRTNYSESGLFLIGGRDSGGHTDWWERDRVDLDLRLSSADFQVVIEAKLGEGVEADVSLDDISLTPGCLLVADDLPGAPTPPTPTPSPCGVGMFRCGDGSCLVNSQVCDFERDCPGGEDESICGTDCDFESGFCGWINSKGSNLYWKRWQGMTAAWLSGPFVDHTFGNSSGHYALVSIMDRKSLSSRAQLQTAMYPSSNYMCKLRFFYHMYGAAVGTLRVYIKTLDGLNPKPEWELSGNQGPVWHKQEVFVGPYYNFAVVFDVSHYSTSVQGNVALDDISFEDCHLSDSEQDCAPNQFRCADKTQCIPEKYRCDGKALCNDGSDEVSCTFVAGNCAFKAADWTTRCMYSSRDDVICKWQSAIGLSSPRVDGTGPSEDAAGGETGRFVQIGPNCTRPGDSAVMETPRMLGLEPKYRDRCFLRFWYHMYDAEGSIGSELEMGTLNVYIQDTNNQRMLIWRQAGNQGDKWQYTNIPVGQTAPYSVLFEAVRGRGARSIIALDKVSFTEACDGGSAFPDKNNGSLVCNTGLILCPSENKCIPVQWRCDGVRDCSDGSDERNCVGPPVTSKPHKKENKEDTLSKSRTILLAVFFSILGVCIIAAVVFFLYRRRSKWVRTSAVNNTGVSINNPLFEMPSENTFEVNVFDR